MSVARDQFVRDVSGLRDALSMEQIAAGAGGPVEPPKVVILRRGILIAALIAFESFVRDRTEELLNDLNRWPSSYSDLPQRLRDAALLNSLTYLQRYAEMLRRQGEDYESEIVTELQKMARTTGPAFGFSKFVSGDFTGNISEERLRGLVSVFGILNCWHEFRTLSTQLGFGVPAVDALLAAIVRKRHMSAHSAGFVPTAADITSLPSDLTCLGICFDVSMTTALAQGLTNWQEFKLGRVNWLRHVDTYFVEMAGRRFRLVRAQSTRAIKLLDDVATARTAVPRPQRGRVTLLVERDASRIPTIWDIIT